MTSKPWAAAALIRRLVYHDDANRAAHVGPGRWRVGRPADLFGPPDDGLVDLGELVSLVHPWWRLRVFLTQDGTLEDVLAHDLAVVRQDVERALDLAEGEQDLLVLLWAGHEPIISAIMVSNLLTGSRLKPKRAMRWSGLLSPLR